MFGFRAKTEADKKKAKPKEEREILHGEPANGRSKVADDLGSLKEKKKQFIWIAIFTNKKEYIEWIVTAKGRKHGRKDKGNDGEIRRGGRI